MPAGAHGRAAFGVLHCGCGNYPVVDGIPIIVREPVGMFEHMSNAAQVAGVSPSGWWHCSRRGHAMTRCLSVWDIQ
jgi:hypothetical protein